MKDSLIEKWRKENCYCVELAEPDICKSCGQELPEIKVQPCMSCKMVEDLKKLADKTEDGQ